MEGRNDGTEDRLVDFLGLDVVALLPEQLDALLAGSVLYAVDPATWRGEAATKVLPICGAVAVRDEVRARAELGSKTTLLIIPSRITTDWSRSRNFSAPANEP